MNHATIKVSKQRAWKTGPIGYVFHAHNTFEINSLHLPYFTHFFTQNSLMSQI